LECGQTVSGVRVRALLGARDARQHIEFDQIVYDAQTDCTDADVAANGRYAPAGLTADVCLLRVGARQHAVHALEKAIAIAKLAVVEDVEVARPAQTGNNGSVSRQKPSVRSPSFVSDVGTG